MSVVQLGGPGGAGGVTVHGALTGLLADDHTQYLLLAGRAGGQSAFGGTAFNDELVLVGSTDALRGRVSIEGPTSIIVEGVGDQSSLRFQDTFSTGGAFIGGCLVSTGTVTYNSSTFIFGTFAESKVFSAAVGPGFAAYTVMNILPTIQNSGNFNLVGAIGINCAPNHSRITSGTSVATNTFGFSFVPMTRATISGAVMTKTNQTAVQCAPRFSTVSGSTANLGTIVGLDCVPPVVGLFQPQSGVEAMTAFIGLRFPAMTFGGNVLKAAVQSSLNIATNSYFLRQLGTAASDFAGSHIYFNDNFGVAFGQVGTGNFDSWVSWNGTGNYHRTFFSANSSSLRWSNPASNRFLFDNDGGNTTGEYNFNCARFSMGAQTGAVGNQVGVFVTPARTVTVGGEWSDFLLTQGANITVDAAMGLVAAWTINTPSITIGTGSVTTAAGLNVGGNPTNATNRVGVRIISNPTGGGGVNAALWVTAGRSQFDGFVDINKPVALGGGAVPTLGTIGGAGPTAAAQAQWVQIEVNGVNHWIPAWT